jgi:hypothetical protein
MAHYRNTYKFETEAEAIAFADNARANKCPSEDKYVTGPCFMDENVIFKYMEWANTGKTWWQVDIEIYS